MASARDEAKKDLFSRGISNNGSGVSRIVGIDLGTTNSLVAAVDAGIPYVIAGADGQRLTPSVVNFPREGTPIVGHPAQRLRAIEPGRTVYSVKRFIGRRGSEIGQEELAVSYRLNASGKIEIGERALSSAPPPKLPPAK